MTDIFEEAEESLRTKEWINRARVSAPWVAAILGGSLIIALGIWGYNAYTLSVVHKSAETYQAGIEALGTNDKVLAKTKFIDVSKTGSSNYKALAFMQIAGLELTDQKTDLATAALENSAKVTNDPMLKDMAILKLAYIKMDKANYSDIEQMLKPLINSKRPLSFLAKEALAMAKLQAGDIKGARSDLNILSVTLGAPEGVKSAAIARVNAIDSGVDRVARDTLKLPEIAAPSQAAPQALPTQQ